VRPLLLVRNDPVDTLGIAPKVLADEGVDVVVVDALDERARWPDVAEISGIVMFGGAMNVDELNAHPFLSRDRLLAREAVERGVPYLGICLGAQLLARAMERAVFRAPAREIGFEPISPTAAAADDRLLSHYRDGDLVFHWHEDTLELPEGAVQLAAGVRVPVQAFRVGDAAWGIQFHLEIDAAEIDVWLDDFGEGLAAAWGKSPERILAEAASYLDGSEARGAETLRRFAELAREAPSPHRG
jgi:GMP synthase (glutamine-hydrolysing)